MSFKNISETAMFLNDLMRNEHSPVNLNVIDCWTRSERLEMMRFSGAPIKYMTKNGSFDVPVDDFTNKLWFVVDMQCESSHTFLDKVCCSIFIIYLFFKSIAISN